VSFSQIEVVVAMADWNQYDFNAPGANAGGGGQGQGQGQGGGGQGEFYNSQYDYAAQNQPQQPAYMVPAAVGDPADFGGGGGGHGGGDDFSDEAPLLEELGINVEHILQKTLAVLNPFRATKPEVAGDSDLAGPLVFCLAFGFLLLFVGKVHFNYIYGIGVLGCIAMYGLLSMMSMAPVPFTVIVSVLGYCILPIVMLSALSVVISLQGVVGNVFSAAAVLWCALSASKLFVTAFNMEQQQLLVAYPCSLVYAVFALITMF
jgi:hypothetical protein